MAIEPYLFFNGRCEEAVEFYKKALGAEVLMLMRYKESPEPPPPGMVPAGWDNKIMHSSLRIGDANLMASDGCSEGPSFKGFSLSFTAANEAEASRIFRRARRRRPSTDAARKNFLVALFRHGRRPLRRRVDGQRGALTFFRRQKMKYLLLVHHDEAAFEKIAKEKQQQMLANPCGSRTNSTLTGNI